MGRDPRIPSAAADSIRGYFRPSLREEVRRLNGGGREKEPVLSTICVHAMALANSFSWGGSDSAHLP